MRRRAFLAGIIMVMVNAYVSAQAKDSEQPFPWSPEVSSYVGQAIATDESTAKSQENLFYAEYLPGDLDPLTGLCAASSSDNGGNVGTALFTLRKIPEVELFSHGLIEVMPERIRPVYEATVNYRSFGTAMDKAMRAPSIGNYFSIVRAIPGSELFKGEIYSTLAQYLGLGDSLNKLRREPTIGNYFSTVRAILGASLFRGHTLVLESFVYAQKAMVESQFNSDVDKYLKGQGSGIQRQIGQYWKKATLPSSNLNLSSVLNLSPKYPNATTLSDVTRMYKNPSVTLPNTSKLPTFTNYNKFSMLKITTPKVSTINIPQAKYDRNSSY